MVWQTVRRLLEAGIDPSDVHRQLRLALGARILAAAGGDAELDEEGYVASLARLPLPTAARVEQVIVEVFRERQPIDADEVDRLVAERLGLALDDPLAEMLLDQVHEQLWDDGPLALLACDEVVHVPTLAEGIVLTYRLTEDERSTGSLTATDLPAVDRAGPLRHREGRVHAYRDDDGVPRWLSNGARGGRVVDTDFASDRLNAVGYSRTSLSARRGMRSDASRTGQILRPWQRKTLSSPSAASKVAVWLDHRPVRTCRV